MAIHGQRALLTISAFGGGQFTMEKLAKFVTRPDALKQLQATFGTTSATVCAPSIRAGDTAMQRVDTVIKAMRSLDKATRITIATYSGGGFVARCLLARLMAEDPAMYERIDLLVVKDGAMNGAHVPPALFYMAEIVDAAKRYGHGSLARDVVIDATVPDELKLPMARELLYVWPTDFSDTWVQNKTSRVNHTLPLRCDPSREAILHHLAELEYKKNWGQGVTKVAYSNGSTLGFPKKSSTLLYIEGTRFVPPYQRKLIFAMRSTKTRYNFVNLDMPGYLELKGSHVDTVSLRNSQKEPEGCIDYEFAPGCHYGPTSCFANTLKTTKKMMASFDIQRTEAVALVCYIPTVSSLFIDETPNWIVGKSDEAIRSASRFDEVHWAPTNLNHGNDHHSEAMIDRILAG